MDSGCFGEGPASRAFVFSEGPLSGAFVASEGAPRCCQRGSGVAFETSFTANASAVRSQRRETTGGSRVHRGADSFPGAFIRYQLRNQAS